MSSHREAPEISKNPNLDSTDVYAFVSPDKPTHVTLIANYIPLQQPNGGPNFYEFAENTRYDIKINNDGGIGSDITYRFEFKTKVRNPNVFLYNTGQISAPEDATWNRPQTFTLTKIERAKNFAREVLISDASMPPCNVGVRSTPNYAAIAEQTYHTVGDRTVFCGQRADAFRVDLGSVFDLGGLRPLNQAHQIPLTTMDGINAVKPFNVHTIALQVPIAELHAYGYAPTSPNSKRAVIGVWTACSRQRSQMFNPKTGTSTGTGPYDQVSRLGNPLVNEVLIGMGDKDKWNATEPRGDKAFDSYITNPVLATLLPSLYPGAFPNLAAYKKPRADLQAILHTGIPAGVVAPNFSTFTSATPQDMVRLNLAIKPKSPDDDGYSVLGVIGGDVAGFPNGRRPADDVTTIELRAVAGATIPLVDDTYTADDAVANVKDGSYDNDNSTSIPDGRVGGNLNAPLLDEFPYLGTPNGGYQTTNADSQGTSAGFDGASARKKQ